MYNRTCFSFFQCLIGSGTIMVSNFPSKNLSTFVLQEVCITWITVKTAFQTKNAKIYLVPHTQESTYPNIKISSFYNKPLINSKLFNPSGIPRLPKVSILLKTHVKKLIKENKINKICRKIKFAINKPINF